MSRVERMVDQVLNWRRGYNQDPLAVAESLPAADQRSLRTEIEDCIAGRGGESAARRRATGIAACFVSLNDEGKKKFFELLADDFDYDDRAVDQAIDDVIRAPDAERRRGAEIVLRSALRPRRELLFRRFVSLVGGLPFLVDLREDLLPIRHLSGALRTLDGDLRRILDRFFDVGLLKLERLTWDSPATVLERLMEYEAVHEISSWSDLKGRLDVGRRCYAFFHPAMPGDPLIFVEVALTRGIADRLPPLIDSSADREDPELADTAIFYSISNCHRGLAGVSLGDFLIKSVVEELSEELPNLQTFATLSPIPGFRAWLEEHLDDPDLLLPEEIDAARLREFACGEPPASSAEIAPAKLALLRLAARYLIQEKRSQGTAADSVANFHLSNGAIVEQLNWWANPGRVGWERGLGMMVNYRYLPRTIESNHDAYLTAGSITSSESVRKLLK